jgi:hypothetical protein
MNAWSNVPFWLRLAASKEAREASRRLSRRHNYGCRPPGCESRREGRTDARQSVNPSKQLAAHVRGVAVFVSIRLLASAALVRAETGRCGAGWKSQQILINQDHGLILRRYQMTPNWDIELSYSQLICGTRGLDVSCALQNSERLLQRAVRISNKSV